MRQSVARCVHRRRRLLVVLGHVLRVGKVGQVRDDDVERRRHAVQQVGLQDVDALAERVSFDVRTRDADGLAADVGRPDLRVRRMGSDRDGDRARAGADIGNAMRIELERLGDEQLRRPARREDASRLVHERQPIEGGFHSLPPWPIGRRWHGSERNGTGTGRVDFRRPRTPTSASGS